MNRYPAAVAQTLVQCRVCGATVVMACYQPSVHLPLATSQTDVVPPAVLTLAGAWEVWSSGPAMNVDGEGEINVKDPGCTFTHFFSCPQVKVQVSLSTRSPPPPHHGLAEESTLVFSILTQSFLYEAYVKSKLNRIQLRFQKYFFSQ